MGSAGKAMTKLAKSVGVVKPVEQPKQLAETKAKEKTIEATAAEKQDAAARRARRMGQRQLLAGGRLGSGTDEEGLKTTLG
jgi:hypothetical protein